MEELQADDLGNWPREALYALVPSMPAVDKAIAANPTNGRQAIKALRELLTPVAKDGYVVIAHGGQKRKIPAKWFAELVYQTRNAELATVRNLARFRSAGIDTVKISMVRDGGKCANYAGKVYSISGRHPKYPPLSTLLATGAVTHVACKALPLAYVEGLN